ncbi:hypothetical protein [Microseira sp. BLCC-F43]
MGSILAWRSVLGAIYMGWWVRDRASSPIYMGARSRSWERSLKRRLDH